MFLRHSVICSVYQRGEKWEQFEVSIVMLPALFLPLRGVEVPSDIIDVFLQCWLSSVVGSVVVCSSPVWWLTHTGRGWMCIKQMRWLQCKDVDQQLSRQVDVGNTSSLAPYWWLQVSIVWNMKVPVFCLLNLYLYHWLNTTDNFIVCYTYTVCFWILVCSLLLFIFPRDASWLCVDMNAGEPSEIEMKCDTWHMTWYSHRFTHPPERQIYCVKKPTEFDVQQRHNKRNTSPLMWHLIFSFTVIQSSTRLLFCFVLGTIPFSPLEH